MNVEIKSLNYQVGKNKILNNITTAFEGKKLYGIIGPNGCGKTTLLRHIYRKLPSRGEILLDGRDINSYSRRDYAKKIAVMMQHQDFAESDIKVWDVVEAGRYPYKKLLTAYDHKDEQIVEQVIEETGLRDFKDRSISTLSGGELQRVMLAKCFAQQPEIILLDEPTNHLDIRYKVELMSALRAFDGLVIMTIHDLNLAARYCDILFLMKEGEIILEGTPEQVLEAERLEKTFGVSIGIRKIDHEVWLNV